MFKWKTNVNVANTKYNVANTNYNAANKNYNVANVNYNVANTNYNAANTNYNVANVNYNVANTNYNVANVNYNVANTNYNVANTNHNVANMKLEFWRKYDTIKIFHSRISTTVVQNKPLYKGSLHLRFLKPDLLVSTFKATLSIDSIAVGSCCRFNFPQLPTADSKNKFLSKPLTNQRPTSELRGRD